MLGIRRWQGVAIDLYVGDPALFVSDRCVTLTRLDEVAPVLRAMEGDGLRHLCLVPHVADAQGLMQALMSGLDGMGRPKRFGRVTVVLADRPQYDGYQQALFATFPDEP